MHALFSAYRKMLTLGHQLDSYYKIGCEQLLRTFYFVAFAYADLLIAYRAMARHVSKRPRSCPSQRLKSLKCSCSFWNVPKIRSKNRRNNSLLLSIFYEYLKKNIFSNFLTKYRKNTIYWREVRYWDFEIILRPLINCQ